MEKPDLVLVTGAGGFIGGHLVAALRQRGHARVRAVDVKPLDQWYQRFDDVDNQVLDLSLLESCRVAIRDVGTVYNLAADMGGMGFIELHKADCMLTVLINTHMLMAARDAGVERFFYSSSACVYAADKQTSAAVQPLREEDAYPAMPEDGYGWEKLFSERMCRHFFEDFGLQTRVARYHNVYGPYGTYDGGREKAPAAICRKVIQALLTGSGDIEIWGDGEQTRSFTYIDDCIAGTLKLTDSDVLDPINIGSDELVTINELVDITERIAGVTLRRRYKLDAPKGVRGRNSDNTFVRRKLGWAPSIRLEDGMRQTYEWIYREMTSARPDSGRRSRTGAAPRPSEPHSAGRVDPPPNSRARQTSAANFHLRQLIASQHTMHPTLLCVGPMSKNCVDATIELADEWNSYIVLIASRRQVDSADFGGGYVNRWTTQDFADYVRARDRRGLVLLARDHGGPWQHDLESSRGFTLDEAMCSAMASFEADIRAGFDILHLDPNHNINGSAPTPMPEFTSRTKALLEFCRRTAERHGRDIAIEIGTDEGTVGGANAGDVESMVREVLAFCAAEQLARPEYLVVQTGTKVMETRNVGPLDGQIRAIGELPAGSELNALIALSRREGLLVKEHNADYLSDETLRWHRRSGIHAANVAPEFGVSETRTFIDIARRLRLTAVADRFLALAYASKKWDKWMLPGSAASDEERGIIAGHYVFATPEFAECRAEVERACARRGIDLDRELRAAVKGCIARYLENFRPVVQPISKSAAEVV